MKTILIYLSLVTLAFARPATVSSNATNPLFVSFMNADQTGPALSFILHPGQVVTVDTPHDAHDVYAEDTVTAAFTETPLSGDALDNLAVYIHTEPPDFIGINVDYWSRWSEFSDVYLAGFIFGCVAEAVGLMIRLLRNLPAHRGGEI